MTTTTVPVLVGIVLLMAVRCGSDVSQETTVVFPTPVPTVTAAPTSTPTPRPTHVPRPTPSKDDD